MPRYRPSVGLVLFNPQKEVFLGKRLFPKNLPFPWQFPQGGIEEGESPFEAALRELKEEVSLSEKDVEIIKEHEPWLSYDLPPLLGRRFTKDTQNRPYDGQKQKWFLMRVVAPERLSVHTAHPEFSKGEWFFIEEAVERVVPFKRAVYQAVEAAFKPVIREFPEAL